MFMPPQGQSEQPRSRGINQADSDRFTGFGTEGSIKSGNSLDNSLSGFDLDDDEAADKHARHMFNPHEAPTIVPRKSREQGHERPTREPRPRSSTESVSSSSGVQQFDPRERSQTNAVQSHQRESVAPAIPPRMGQLEHCF